MKKFLHLLLFLGVILLAYVLLKPQPEQQLDNTQWRTSLPWDIEQLSGGNTRVFGLIPGSSRVEEALALLGVDHEIAIISDQQEKTGLEVYFSHFKAGPLAGKLILTTNVSEEDLLRMREQASNSKYMASGARQFFLNPEDLQTAYQLTINSITFIPSAQLDAEIIASRFGTADTIVHSEEGTVHHLFTTLGLDITLNEDARDSLQYVSPSAFTMLSDPLKDLGAATETTTEK